MRNVNLFKNDYLCRAMKRLSCILLFVMFVLFGFAQRIERVYPLYSGNKSGDQMVEYIAENLQLIIPSGKDLEKMNTMMKCKITIDEEGKIVDIIITRHTELWLELVIVDGLKRITPSEKWSIEVAQELQKELVFSFGNMRRGKSEYGFRGERVAQSIENQLEEDRQKQKKQHEKETNKWNKVEDKNLKVEMPISPGNNKNPHPVINPRQIVLPPDPDRRESKVEISLE